MAPRTYADKPKRQTSRILKSSSSTDVRTRMSHTHRSARTGTVTQLETAVPHAFPPTRHSPISRGKLLLEAADQLDLPEELEALCSAIKDRKSEYEFNMRFIPTGWAASPALQLPQIGIETSPEEATEVIEQITDYFDFWSKDDLQEGPASLFADMRLINVGLEDVAALPWEITSSPIVSTALRECIDLYETFVEIWRQAVLEALVIKLDQLRAQVRARVNGRPATIHEIEFTSFNWDVAAVSPLFLRQAMLSCTDYSIPLLVSEAATQLLHQSTDRLLSAFQDATYETEAKELWLLVWRSLKVAFAAFSRGGAPTSPTNTLRDRRFFEIPLVRLEMHRLIASNEAPNPRRIEKVVGKYCWYIDRCQVDQGNKYESLHRTQESPLESHTKDALKEFCKTGKFETSTLSKLHFAVARFNKINGGPVRVRRWEAPYDNGTWQMIPMTLDAPATPQVSPSIRDHNRKQQAIQSSPPFTPRSPSFGDNTVDRPAKRVFPHPEGINLKSDFDYVWCPFPETRAHEVAQNEQITRELADPGILSEGPRPDYLINRPPRHTRDPAELSRRNFGPFPWIRFVIQQLLAKERRLPNVKKPNFVGLLPRKERKSSSDSGSVIIDRSTRVHKPTASAQVSRLRGGAGRPASRLTGRNRRRHFDPTAFNRKMINLCIREIRGRDGLDVPIDQAEILELLAETGYDIQQVGVRYKALGGGKTTGPIFAGPPRLDENSFYQATADQDQHVHPLHSLYVNEHSGEHDRVNNSPRATGDGFEGQDIYDDDDYDPDQENEDPDQWDRTPLGELDISGYRDNRSDRSVGVSPSSHGVETSRPHCHRCPTFQGQYHHYCPDLDNCWGYEISSPRVPSPHAQIPHVPNLNWYTHLPNSNVHPQYFGPRNGPVDGPHQGQGNSGPNRTDGQDDHDRRSENGDHNEGDDVEPDDPPLHEEPVDEADEDDDVEQDDPPPPPPPPPPPREKPADEDQWTVKEVFGELAPFTDNLDEMGPRLATIQRHLASQARTSDAAEQLTKAVRELRGIYVDRLQQKPFVETIDENEYVRPRASRRAHPATPELCKRAFRDVWYRRLELYRFFDFDHPRANLGFRNALNALIVAVREFHMLLREHDLGLEDPDFNNGDDDDDEEDDEDDEEDGNAQKPIPPSKPSSRSPRNPHSGSVVTPRLPRKSPPKPADKPAEKPKKATKSPDQVPLPGVEEYNRMFVTELVRELEKNRKVNIKEKLDKKNPVKKDYIDLLMQLDKEGNVGRGATEAYRNITGNWTARAPPKNWKLEVEVKKYRDRKAAEKEATKSPEGASSRKSKTSPGRSKGSGQTVDYGAFQQ